MVVTLTPLLLLMLRLMMLMLKLMAIMLMLRKVVLMMFGRMSMEREMVERGSRFVFSSSLTLSLYLASQDALEVMLVRE